MAEGSVDCAVPQALVRLRLDVPFPCQICVVRSRISIFLSTITNMAQASHLRLTIATAPFESACRPGRLLRAAGSVAVRNIAHTVSFAMKSCDILISGF